MTNEGTQRAQTGEQTNSREQETESECPEKGRGGGKRPASWAHVTPRTGPTQRRVSSGNGGARRTWDPTSTVRREGPGAARISPGRPPPARPGSPRRGAFGAGSENGRSNPALVLWDSRLARSVLPGPDPLGEPGCRHRMSPAG